MAGRRSVHAAGAGRLTGSHHPTGAENKGGKMNNGAKGVTTGPAAADQEVSNGRPPTAADGGRLAGVSRSTVSLVLNEVPDSRIPEETRERVRVAAAQLGY